LKAIVFGGSGFLGSHVAEVLSDNNYDVIVYDIKESPYIVLGQQMIVGDILDQKSVEAATQGCDIVYNLAGIADIDDCKLRPLEVIQYNIMGNAIILEAARKANIKRYVFASSVYVYSNAGSFYRSSKQACESFIENYYSTYNLPYTIIRYGSLYGERADERNGLYKILKEAIATGKIKHFGDGDEVREYIHVRDAAELSIEILKKEYEGQNVVLTGSQPLKYYDLLEMINEILGNQIEIEYMNQRKTAHYKITPYSFNPKIGRKLVKNPYVDMGQGLLSLIAEIYAEVHGEKCEKMGILINKNGIDNDDE
jgi:UDP-glucose 4-epimerase